MKVLRRGISVAGFLLIGVLLILKGGCDQNPSSSNKFPGGPRPGTASSSPQAEEKQTETSSTRWVKVDEIGFNLLGMKKEIRINAEKGKELFTKQSPHLRENWEKGIPGKVENAKDARTMSEELKKTKTFFKATGPNGKPSALVLQFSKKELVVVVVEFEWQYLWNQYYQCLACFRLPREHEIDSIFDLESLEKTFGAEHKGLKQGDSATKVTQTLGNSDAKITFQAGSFYQLCYFEDDIIISINNEQIQRFDLGVPWGIKEEVRKKGPVLTHY